MTEGALEVDAQRPEIVCCRFCLRRLANEFYFTCRECQASYCYIHMSRHGRRVCRSAAGEPRARVAQAPLAMHSANV